MFGLGGRPTDEIQNHMSWFPDRPAESECDNDPSRVPELPEGVEGYALGAHIDAEETWPYS